MTAVSMSAMSTGTDNRPWRKRHPVLSRVVLFGIGALVVAGLWFAKQQREAEDRHVRLRGELESFDVIIWVPGGPEIVQQKLAADFGGDLPADLRAGALRWEAMALRHQARDGDEEAAARIEPTYEKAMALAPDADMRIGLMFERAEARLERDDAEGALALIGAADLPQGGPWALMREHFSALAQALTGDPDEALRRIDAALDELEPPLALEPSVTAGGRTWNRPEIATVATERLALLYQRAGKNEAGIWRRLSALAAYDCPSQVICAKNLVRVGDDVGAATAWGRAVRAAPDEAARWAEQDPALRALQDAAREN